MLTNVNTNGPSQCLFALPEEENKLTLANSTEQVECTVYICKQLSDQLDLIQRLYVNELLPHLKSTGQPFIKESRKKHTFLENSILADKSGNVFEQYHWRDKKGILVNVKEKGLLGKGAHKRVWDLKPLHPNYAGTQMVRARFDWVHSRSNTTQEQARNLEKLKNEVNSRFLLIPDTITYTSYCGLAAIVQMMPKALGGDLFDILRKMECLSYLGRLRVMRNVGLGLMDMHEKQWAHLDVKPKNIALMDQDPDSPISKLCDFDFTRKFKPKESSTYIKGTPLYMDPKCLNNKATGLEDAKIHDQFSFGITLCEVLTGITPREELKVIELRAWVTEKDLKEVSGFSELDENIRNIIMECCVGPTEMRPYRLPDYVAAIEMVINDFITKQNAKRGAEYVISHSISGS